MFASFYTHLFVKQAVLTVRKLGDWINSSLNKVRRPHAHWMSKSKQPTTTKLSQPHLGDLVTAFRNFPYNLTWIQLIIVIMIIIILIAWIIAQQTFTSFFLPGKNILFRSIDVGLGNVSCFGHWDVSRCDKSNCLKWACIVGLALLADVIAMKRHVFGTNKAKEDEKNHAANLNSICTLHPSPAWRATLYPAHKYSWRARVMSFGVIPLHFVKR